MANLLYPAFKRSLGNGLFNLSADPLKCALLKSTYLPDLAHAVFADVAGHEASGDGYTAGGQALSDVAWTVSGTACVLAAASPVWSEATVTARYAAVYAAKTVGSVADPLVCLLDFGADKGVVGGVFTAAFDAAGILGLD
uniref:Uncharacterized protein n=1 Tax=Desulfovibrio sp. U5L TaxID=596152 RepID=I2PYP2_9BACT